MSPTTKQPTAAAPEPAPRFAAAWAALTYIVATFTLAYPALTGGYLATVRSDQFIGGYAVRTFGTEWLKRTGHFPLWNPFLYGGMPYIGAMNGDIFYPPSLIVRLLARPDVFVTWMFIIHIFFAGWLTYLFLRKAGVGFTASLVGGLAYMLGGPIASYVSPGHDGKLYVSALMPLALLFLTYGMRDGSRWAWPALAFTVGFAILSPHPQLTQYMLLATGAWGLYLAFWDSTPLPRHIAIRRIGLGLAAVILGLLMGAIQFLPVAQYTSFSPRGGAGAATHGYEWAASYSMPPEELFNTYLPQFSGILDAYWGRTGIHFQSEYLGVIVLLLAGCAFIGTLPERRRVVRYWIIVGIVATLWSLGGYTPFYHLVYALIPGTRYFRAPATMFFVTGFAVAVLAAEGVDNVLRRVVRMRYTLGWVGFAALIALLAVAGVITTISAGLATPQAAELVQANASAVTIGAVRALVFIVLAAGVLLLVRDDKVPTRAAGAVLALLVVADLWSVERLYWNFSPPASVVYASDSLITYLQHQKEPARVTPVQLADGPRDPMFYDELMIHRLRQSIGYHGNEIYRYDVLAGHDEGYRPLLSSPQIWRLLNIRFLLTNVGNLKAPGLQLVMGPVTDAAGSTLYLYRLPGDNPAAWVTPVSVKAGDEQALATVTDSRFDPQVAAVYDTSAQVQGQVVQTLPSPLGITATVTRYDPGNIAVHLERPAPAGASLIVSENYFPGWTATVDGKPAPVGRADYTLIGVPLPAGATNIELTFRSSIDRTGKLVTLCMAGLALLWWVAAGITSRRRHG